MLYVLVCGEGGIEFVFVSVVVVQFVNNSKVIDSKRHLLTQQEDSITTSQLP